MTDPITKSAIKQLELYKLLGEKTFAQLNDEMFNRNNNDSTNSIATIVKHLRGNMLSRWTDFLNTDGEKEWRKRDEEFEKTIISKNEVSALWNEGWKCLGDALGKLSDNDLMKTVSVRGEKHTVIEAIHRELAHYASHVGQIVLLGKMMRGKEWKTLSIPIGESEKFNAEKFRDTLAK
jgi:hypothetical protein